MTLCGNTRVVALSSFDGSLKGPCLLLPELLYKILAMALEGGLTVMVDPKADFAALVFLAGNLERALHV